MQMGQLSTQQVVSGLEQFLVPLAVAIAAGVVLLLLEHRTRWFANRVEKRSKANSRPSSKVTMQRTKQTQQLDTLIDVALDLIHQYDVTLQTEKDPTARKYQQHEQSRHRELLKEYLTEYVSIARSNREDLPNRIRSLAIQYSIEMD